MKIKILGKGMISQFVIDNYYIIVIMLYFITLKRTNFPVGTCSALLMMVIGVILVGAGKIGKRVTQLDALVLVYVLYCLGSVIWVIMNGIPVSVYIKAVTNSLFPVVFYFCARGNSQVFYKRFLYAVNVCCMAGIVLWAIKPAWYVSYCINYGYSFTRLVSCIGSTAVGSLSVIAIVISVWRIYLSKGKEGKILYLLFVVYAFASMQRSAWIVALASLVVMHYFLFFKWRTLKLQYLSVEIAGIILVGIAARNQIISLLARWMLEHEVSGGYGLFSSRTGQWEAALKTSNLLFGNGYGTVGHKAIGYAENIVADGSWVCLLCEIGIIGLALFLAIIIMVTAKGLRNFKNLFLPIVIIAGICLQAMGSNMFEFQIIMPIFWYAVGEISYSGRIKSTEQENENIRNIFASVS